MSLSFKHTLSHNKGNARPKHVIFADVESYLHPQADGKTYFEPFLWTAVYKNYRKGNYKNSVVKYAGTEIDRFWDIVEKHCYAKSKTYLVTHHLEVDFMPLKGITQLQGRGWVLDKLISHSKILIMWWRSDKSTLIVMNNGNLFDGSIAGWGEVLGVPKLTMPAESDPLNDWITYCQRDTDIMVLMWDFLLDFMDTHNLGNFKLTKAGLAMNAYRHRFMVRPVAIHGDNASVLLERLSYKGGRFEALKIGTFENETFYNLDINSMYGYIEMNNTLPYELRGYKDDPTLQDLHNRLKKYAVIAEVRVKIDIPVLPQRDQMRVFYKPGEFDTVLTTPELLFCIQNEYIISIKRMTWYYQYPILSPYAQYFLELKDQYDREGNQPLRQFAKLYLNSLYGKFGQKGYEDLIIGECDPELFEFIDNYNADNGTHSTVAKYGGKIHQTIISEVGYNTLVAVASHITAYGRLMLWQLIEMAGYENTYHVATDSLIVNEEGYKRLQSMIDPHRPGSLKLETTFDRLVIKDVNDTIQGITIKIKGVPKKAEQISENSYKMTEWPRLITLLKAGNIDNYYTRSVIKTLHRPRYYKSLGIDHPELKTDKVGRLMKLKAYDQESILIFELKDEQKDLKAKRLIEHSDMLKYWNYRKQDFRQIKNDNDDLVSFEFADHSKMLEKYKLESAYAFMCEVQDQAYRDLRLREIEELIKIEKAHLKQTLLPPYIQD